MEKKKICWITPDYYLDTDLYIVPYLSRYFFIDWYIVYRGKFLYEKDVCLLEKSDSLAIYKNRICSRERSFKTFIAYFKIAVQIRKSRPNVLYTGIFSFPYAFLILRTVLHRLNIILPIHNVTTPKGASNFIFAKWNTSKVLNTFENFQTFSKSQYEKLKQLKPNKNVFYAPFLLKDYGEPSTQYNDKITFLNFGNIRDYKRIDVLIESVQRAYELTKIEFLVEIAGNCDNWEKYQNLIRYPQLFSLNIRTIDNSEIPNLFARSHYFVVPYQDIAQSGSTIISINYSVPIIASNLEAFREYVIDGENGYFIRPASPEDLTAIIVNILHNHDKIYPNLVNGINKMKNTNFSTQVIVERYRKMLDSL